ncbi:MAG: hypothetical protein Q4D57_05965 [Clostridia bacterium]|nr:hypothetical protein [Clostridia bacterium]
MAIAFTNKRKALNLLKEGGFNTTEIEKGGAEKFTLDSKKLKSIAEGDEDNVFRILNKSGKLLADSVLTRSTGHKENDYSSVQSASALALEKFFISLESNIDDAINNDETFSDDQKKIIKKKISKIWVTLREALKAIGASDELKKFVEDEMSKSQSEIKANFTKILSDVDLNKRSDGLPTPTVAEMEAAKKGVEQDVKECYKQAGLGWIAGPAFVTGTLFISGLYMTTIPLLVWGCVCGGAFGISVAVALGLIVTGLVINANQESFAKIKIKKKVIRIQGILTKVLGQINELNRTAKQMRKENLKDQLKDEAELPSEITKKIKDFVEAQGKLWAKYATAAARNYDHGKDSNKHKSAGKLVSDEKTSGIGKVKQGLANQWCSLEIK